jgi:DNA-binding protein YbaB|tara:strand:- start:152 stop:796 length:645 start_codon:yes stop_codon:yes gene_type:complete
MAVETTVDLPRKTGELSDGRRKSTVSKLCKDIDERVGGFLDRPLTGEWPYLWLDATYLKQREGGRIVSVAAIIAVAVNTDGKREIVGLHIGPSEAETFWSTFLKSLVRRGLSGVKLVISDAHEGLKAAIRRVFSASWQRCRVGLLNKSAFEASQEAKIRPVRLKLGGAFVRVWRNGEARLRSLRGESPLYEPEDEDGLGQIGASRFRLMAAAVR